MGTDERTFKAVCQWLRGNAKAGNIDPACEGLLAAMTGQDARAVHACALLLELYAASDPAGRVAAIQAIRAVVLGGMQVKIRPLVRELIARALDWTDRDPLWASIMAVPVSAHPDREELAGGGASSSRSSRSSSSDLDPRDAPIPYALTALGREIALELSEVKR